MIKQVMKLENELTISLTKLNIETILPVTVTPQKFVQLASMAVMNSSYIASLVSSGNVDFDYMANQLIMCARDGLLLDGKEATFTPFFSKKKGKYELTYIPMMLGLKKRVMASGDIVMINSFVVYEGESFKHYRTHDGEFLHHEPSYDNNGEVKLAYAVAKDKYGNAYVEVASKQKINASMLSSSGSGNSNSPWVKHYDRMAELVPLRRLCKKLNASELSSLTERGYEQGSNDQSSEIIISQQEKPKQLEKPKAKPNYSQMGFDEICTQLDLVNSRNDRHHLIMLNDRCKELLGLGCVSKEEVLMLKSKIANAKSNIS